MKIRSGFVSNSSSSSFVVYKSKLDKDELDFILHPLDNMEVFKKRYEFEMTTYDGDEETDPESEYYIGFDYWFESKFGSLDPSDLRMWEVNESATNIKFDTIMNNFQWEEVADIFLPKDSIGERYED